MRADHATDAMRFVVTCPMPTCSWQWHHYLWQTVEAGWKREKHLEQCVINRPCPACHAPAGEACRTRNNTTTHRPHNARRSAA